MIWKQALHPCPKVFCIGAMLAEPYINRMEWNRIRHFISEILLESGLTAGGDCGFDFYEDLKPFMDGRMNAIEARILELCMIGNITNDINFFRNAYDIVDRIVELEEGRFTGGEDFAHNAKPELKLNATVCILRPMIYIK